MYVQKCNIKEVAEKGVAELIGCLQGTSQRFNRNFLKIRTKGTIKDRRFAFLNVTPLFTVWFSQKN